MDAAMIAENAEKANHIWQFGAFIAGGVIAFLRILVGLNNRSINNIVDKAIERHAERHKKETEVFVKRGECQGVHNSTTQEFKHLQKEMRMSNDARSKENSEMKKTLDIILGALVKG